jgi:hypothetical protein
VSRVRPLEKRLNKLKPLRRRGLSSSRRWIGRRLAADFGDRPRRVGQNVARGLEQAFAVVTLRVCKIA